MSIEKLNDSEVQRIVSLVRAAADEEVTTTVEGVEILKAGIEYQLASGDTTFTPEDLADAVKAVEDPNIVPPRIKLGHDGPLTSFTSDEPALGTVQNLRLDEGGQTIIGDYAGIPVWLADILASAYPSRSIEGSFAVETEGKEYRLVISAVSLLGVAWPGCTSLEDIQALYSKEGPDNITVIEAGKGGHMPPSIQASVSAEDVRRQFYAEVAVEDRYWWWITAQYVDPPLLIAEDESGDAFHIRYSISGDSISFEEPVPVNIQYVEQEGGKVAADASRTEPTVVFATAAESRPDERNPNQEEDTTMPDIDVAQLRGALGIGEDRLPDDATPEQINEVLAESQEEGDPPEPANSPDPEEETGTPPDEQTRQDEGSQVPEGMSLIDNETLDELKRGAEQGVAARHVQVESERERFLSDAIKAGKFPPARKEHYEKLLAADEEGTKQLIASLAEGVVPVTERGSGRSGEDTTDQGSYPESWLPEVAAQKNGDTPMITQEA